MRELVRGQRAYPCFCSPERLEENAGQQRRSRSPLGYYGKWARCRSLSVREAGERIAAGEAYTVRLRCPAGLPGRVRFGDLVRGALTMLDNGNDVVVLKSADAEGRRLPTYHLAHVVDDHLMRVNLVVRGEEWISSLPLHHQLHRALGFRPPQYAHIAPLMKLDGSSRRKLSKRKDPESAAGFYEAAGYPAAAVAHYLRGLANSRVAGLATGRALAEPLRLAEMGAAGPMVDLLKLRSLSREYIASLEPAQALAQLGDWAAGYAPELLAVLRKHPDLALAAFEMARRGNGTPRKDLACWQEFTTAYGFCFPELHETVDRPDDGRFGGCPARRCPPSPRTWRRATGTRVRRRTGSPCCARWPSGTVSPRTCAPTGPIPAPTGARSGTWPTWCGCASRAAAAARTCSRWPSRSGRKRCCAGSGRWPPGRRPAGAETASAGRARVRRRVPPAVPAPARRARRPRIGTAGGGRRAAGEEGPGEG